MTTRLCALLLLSALTVSAQNTWRAAIAQVSGAKNPGSAFVVELRNGRTYLVTAAHIVEGASNPEVSFWADADNKYPAEMQAAQPGGGLALLAVSKTLSGVIVVPPLDETPRPGAAALAAGYPLSIAAYAEHPAKIAAGKGPGFRLSAKADEGFAGAPILINGKAAGLLANPANGEAITVQAIRDYLRQFGVTWSARND